MQTYVLSNLFLFQEPAYCKLSYFEILKICDFVNSLKKKGMGVGEEEPIKKKTKKKKQPAFILRHKLAGGQIELSLSARARGCVFVCLFVCVF